MPLDILDRRVGNLARDGREVVIAADLGGDGTGMAELPPALLGKLAELGLV